MEIDTISRRITDLEIRIKEQLTEFSRETGVDVVGLSLVTYDIQTVDGRPRTIALHVVVETDIPRK